MKAVKYINIFLKCFALTALCFVFSCSPQKGKGRIISSKMLYGEWSLVGAEKQINYPEIAFYKDSIAELYSQADTIYRFTFFVRKDSLFLIDNKGKEYVNKIKDISDNTIIFDGIADIYKEQTYKR